MGYLIADKPRPILEAAAATGFKHVPAHIRTKCLKDLNIEGLRLPHQQVGALINAFRHTWGWSDVDVAMAMQQHMETAASKSKNSQRQPKRKPPPEADVYGNTLRDEIQDILDAARAFDAPPDEQTAAAAAVPSQDGMDDTLAEALELAQNNGKGGTANPKHSR